MNTVIDSLTNLAAISPNAFMMFLGAGVLCILGVVKLKGHLRVKVGNHELEVKPHDKK